jgi:hypothetical protein
MAKQRSTFEARFRRIWEMILTCAYGFTDLSYTRRLNIPLELPPEGISAALVGAERKHGVRFGPRT